MRVWTAMPVPSAAMAIAPTDKAGVRSAVAALIALLGALVAVATVRRTARSELERSLTAC